LTSSWTFPKINEPFLEVGSGKEKLKAVSINSKFMYSFCGTSMKLADILKDSNYKLSQFKPQEIEWLEESLFMKKTKKGDTPYIKCLVRNKDIQLKPEEAIRQLYLKVLIDRYGYPAERIIVEYPVKFGRETKKADVAIMDADRPTVPYIIVELKKPKEKDGKDQLKSYCNATGAPIGVWTNGDGISRWHRMDPNYFERITDIPKATQTLEDILNIKFTLEDLIANDRLVREKKSLRSLIEEMEDEVLANAGVDVFEEVFKLIFTKLYDEWLSGQGKNRNTRLLEFRNTGQTEGELRIKIQRLFDAAKDKWEGVFGEDSKISLTPSHLAVCVRSLENVKLFNSNLDVIDEAFEYLVNQSSKGEKGQYFTPRYVIDMCVKMLNPQEDEYIIDTAAGSSGFPVHTIFHVWKQILEDEGLAASHLFTIEDKPHRCAEYVEKRVFAIDFDERSVRVARTLNLIAGDGQTNVLHLNTLDFELWDEVTKDERWNDTYNEGFKRLKKLRADKNSYKKFNFDVLMANPPFAGDIKESRIIHRYDLAKKPNGKWQNKVGRDILFIERNLDFLKPGGRMAIVLPQGRFNNSSDKYIRDYIAERCRILAVVGLHGNTFKPHTGTKTSVLLVQKWNDDRKVGPLCRRQEDYNIFFATMRRSGKDNSGEKIYRRILPMGEEGFSEKESDRELLLDDHQHLVIDHDLYNHEGLTEDGIAEAFIEFAKKEDLSFFKLGPSVAPFDAEKYERLMDGLEAVSLKFSELENLITLGAEFYQKQYVEAVYTIKTSKMELNYLDGCSLLITDGDHSATQYQDEGIYYILSESIKEGYIDENIYRFISPDLHKSLKRSQLRPRNVVITKTGVYFGRSAVIPDRFPVANTSAHVGKIEVDEDKINSYYLSTFFNSNYGYLQLRRRGIKATRPEIKLIEFNDILVAQPSKNFQDRVEKIVRQSEKAREGAKKIYQQAEDLLLSELGLKDWQPTNDNIAIKSFSASFGMSDRLDAEYYQPKYDELESCLNKFEKLQIKQIIKYPVSSGSTPKAGGDDYTDAENGVPFIRAVDLKDGRVDPSNFIYIKQHIHKGVLKKTQLKKNDLLFSIAGTVGRCAIFDYDFEANINQAISILRFDEKQVNKLCLTVFFNSEIGKIYLSKYARQGLQTNLNLAEVSNLEIPVLPLNIQKNISNQVQKSFSSKEQSKQLLEIAKTGVEKAIEENEERAIAWINQQLEALGIELPPTP